jgi:hypothetical protein
LEDTVDTPIMPSAKKGRPAGARNHQTLEREKQVVKLEDARSKKKKVEEDCRAQVEIDVANHRALHGAPTRSSTSTAPAASVVTIPSALLIPQRDSHSISSDLVIVILTLMTKLTNEAIDEFGLTGPLTTATLAQIVYGKKIVLRVHELTAVSESSIRQFWGEWCKAEGRRFPTIREGVTRVHKESIIVRLYAGEIRKLIHERKMAGQVTEIPDIQKHLRTEHKVDVTRDITYRSLLKLGYVYGKKTKLMANKQSPRLARLRREYLLAKTKYDAEIEERDVAIALWDSQVKAGNSPVGSRPNRLVYVYVDESYVNKNHSLGYTWYFYHRFTILIAYISADRFHPDDELGAAVVMSSGKGERLVMLTGITKYGIVDHEELDRDRGSLLIFKARYTLST